MSSAQSDNLLNACAVTFDVDWAADWMIDRCVGICRRAGVQATFFATHPSDILSDLARDPLFEIGIHPNFLPNSTHGTDPARVLGTCLDLVPDARAMRSHGLYQWASLFHMIGDDFLQIETDVSLLLPFHQGLRPTDFYTGRHHRRLTRIPFFWEDDVAMSWPNWSWDADPPGGPGVRIFNFHPIHVALNAATIEPYEALKLALDSTPLILATESRCAPFVNSGSGSAEFLQRLVGTMPQTAFDIVSDITLNYRRRDP